jgi:cytochrome c peroxidase
MNINSTLLAFIFCCAIPLKAFSQADWQALPMTASAPANNPTNSQKVELGKKLFFDPRLSLTGTVSCNSCHNLMAGGEDSRPVSMGIEGRLGNRNAPTVWNSTFQASQFWDGRSPSLEDQAKGPMVAEPEMGMASHENAIGRIAAIPGYQSEFRAVFGNKNPINLDNAVAAIAAFERTLITPNSPFDRYVKGDAKALQESQVQGMKLFKSIGCIECHSGPAFNGWEPDMSETEFHEFPRNLDSSYVSRYNLTQDLGRYSVTKTDSDKHAYKVPTLRNIGMTAPYFHNGSVSKLDEAVRVMAETQLDLKISESETKLLIAFLSSLDGPFPEIIMPRLPILAGDTVLAP